MYVEAQAPDPEPEPAQATLAPLADSDEPDNPERWLEDAELEAEIQADWQNEEEEAA